MCVQRKLRGAYARWVSCFCALAVHGCGFSLTPDADNDDSLRSTLSSSIVELDDEATYYEASPNHLFELAEFVDVSDQPRAIRGRVSGPDDVDVFNLGPVMPGDHITVDMELAESLDGAIGLFDETGTSLLVNDHRNVYLGVRSPFVDVVVQHASDACFVAVAGTPGYNSKGDYALVASNEFGNPLPEPRPDAVLLDFDGGRNVRVGSRAPVDVPAFDAANISTAFEGQTNRIISRVIEYVREDYEGLDVAILSTWEGDVFERGMTRIYFGTYDEALLGVAEGVDEFNSEREQTAIIFTDTFAAFTKLDPTVDEISQAIGNVTSHEIGHLMGLVHTREPIGIMDVTASLGGMLRDQSFIRSPIYSAVFPLGVQDAPNYLLDVLGGDPAIVSAKKQRAEWRKERLVQDDREGLVKPARAGLHFSTCTLEGD